LLFDLIFFGRWSAPPMRRTCRVSQVVRITNETNVDSQVGSPVVPLHLPRGIDPDAEWLAGEDTIFKALW
jgi:hypothetical protein